jgi:hypothetical protein
MRMLRRFQEGVRSPARRGLTVRAQAIGTAKRKTVPALRVRPDSEFAAVTLDSRARSTIQSRPYAACARRCYPRLVLRVPNMASQKLIVTPKSYRAQ